MKYTIDVPESFSFTHTVAEQTGRGKRKSLVIRVSISKYAGTQVQFLVRTGPSDDPYETSFLEFADAVRAFNEINPE